MYNAISLLVTEHCNLACTYCFEQYAEEHVGGVMSEEVAEKALVFVVENAKAAGVHASVMLFGGEPTLRPDLCSFVLRRGFELSQKAGVKFSFSMITNCTLFPESLAETIREYLSRCEIQIQLSVDGIKAAQDMARLDKAGGGTFDTVKEVAQRWREVCPDDESLVIHGCLTSETMPYFHDSYRFFKDELGINRMWFLPVCESDWKEADIDFYRDTVEKITADIIAEMREQQSVEPARKIEPFNKAVDSAGVVHKPCGAGDNFCTITANGDIYPCHQLYFATGGKDMQLGSLDEGINEWRAKVYRDYDSSDLSCPSDCEVKECYRCIATNWQESGSILTQGQGLYCELMKIDKAAQDAIRGEIESMGLTKENKDCSQHNPDGTNGCDVVVADFPSQNGNEKLSQLLALQEKKIAFDAAYQAQLIRIIKGE